MLVNRQALAMGFFAAFLVVLLIWLLGDRELAGDCRAKVPGQSVDDQPRPRNEEITIATTAAPAMHAMSTGVSRAHTTAKAISGPMLRNVSR